MPSPKGLGTLCRACLPQLTTTAVITALTGVWLVLLSCSAQADPSTRPGAGAAGCTTAGFLAKDVARRFPGQETVRLSGGPAALFINAYNRIPPVSELVATELLILFHPNFRVTRIAFFRNGCAVAAATVPIPVVRLLLRKSRGASI